MDGCTDGWMDGWVGGCYMTSITCIIGAISILISYMLITIGKSSVEHMRDDILSQEHTAQYCGSRKATLLNCQNWLADPRL